MSASLRRLAGAAALAALVAPLGGCGTFGSIEPQRYYVLEPAREVPASRPPAGETPVRVGRVTAASFYDTEAIAFSRSAGTRGYYQFNRWTDRPARRIGELLGERLQRTASRAGLVLNVRLQEMYHDAADPPGTARVELATELVDGPTRTVLARRGFSQSVPAKTFDAPGAVHAFNQAVGRLLDGIEQWVAAEAR
jgi:cholesterol transport system auxiliary component